MIELDDAGLAALVGALGTTGAPADDGARIDRLEALERIRCAAAAAQARIASELDHDNAVKRRPRDLGAQIGLARHESPQRGRDLLDLARALVDDLPHTLAALAAGDINERRAQIVVRETRDLHTADRRTVDAEIADIICTLGDRQLAWAVRRVAMRLDEAGIARRRDQAIARRRVTGQSNGDGTGTLTAIVSDLDFAAVMTSLRAAAAERTDPGEQRTHSQLMADVFVERLTGRAVDEIAPVALELVVSAETLLGDDTEPGELVGFGPVPGSVIRGLATLAPEDQSTIRRIFRFEETDALVTMESSQRGYTGALRAFIAMRDQICRMPWCDAPIRHIDHAIRHADGGATSARNGQGLCESCDYVKEEPGWQHTVVSEEFAPHEVDVETPTGHHHRSHAPAPPRSESSRWYEVEPGHWRLRP